MDKKQLRTAIDHALVVAADPILFSNGFTRRKRALRYKRGCLAGEQWVAFDYGLPQYSDDPSICHVKVGIGASFADVNENAKFLVDGNRQLGGFSPEVTYAMPVGLCGPENALKEWRPLSLQDLLCKMQEMVVYLQEFGLPFLDEYQTAESLVRGYRKNDQRFMKGHDFLLRVIAAALCAGQHTEAKEIAEAVFGAYTGRRRRYAVLFDRLEQCRG